jgi:sulfate transport system ATP-binding protein
MSVQVHGVTKRFSGPKHPAAVADVSFEAPTGRVTALLGPSGCGKTTLLRLVAGLEQPDAGAVSICGNDVSHAPASARGVGFVFQSYALFRHMSVAQNVGFGLRIRRVGKREIRRRVAELLELVQLEGLDKRFPAELSGGQRQRVALARALAVHPNVLLLDEPFGALDAKVRAELRDFLTRLLEQMKVTTLLVTHDQEEALELAARVVLLHEGRVLQAGAPSELYDAPASARVAAFLGATNVVRGAQLAIFGITQDTSEALEAYVRPSEIRVTGRDARPTGPRSARVERVTRVGAQVKLELLLRSGLPLTALLAKAEFDALPARSGDWVSVELVDPKVFPVSDDAPPPTSEPKILRLNRGKRSDHDLRSRIAGALHPRVG